MTTPNLQTLYICNMYTVPLSVHCLYFKCILFLLLSVHCMYTTKCTLFDNTKLNVYGCFLCLILQEYLVCLNRCVLPCI